MDTVLQQINQVQGVIGCLVCNSGGEVLAQAFPPIFDTSTLQIAAASSVDAVAGLNEYAGGVDLIDLNCNDGRIIIKSMPKGFLFLLCVGTVNMQVLSISLNVAAGKLNAAFATGSPARPTTVPAKSTEGSLRRDDKGFILTVDSLTVSAKIPWDQMQEGVAISKKLSAQICRILDIDAVKKVKLTNKATKTSKTFNNVRIFERDNAQTFDDHITVTLAAAEAVKAKPGDELVVEINMGLFS
jgi:predicted regulator of Ras-like GTPase activity (Roadblock/LC7/MglB family)